MSSTKFTSFSLYTLFPFLLLLLLLLLHVALAANPLYHVCRSPGNITTNGEYEKNLNKLFGNLYLKTPPTGFGLTSTGHHQAKAFGLSLCRGDVSPTNCKSCVADASSQIRTHCPNSKEAVIWYDNCLLKYSNTDFFGKVDQRTRFYMLNLQNVSDYENFNARTKELLSGLAKEASGTPKMYASGETDVVVAKKVYGMVQCTRDVSRVDCRKCLDGAISQLPSCCNGKEGGRVVGATCNIRYEIYPFVSTA
ncbi:hypothetical protein LguiA_035245 [Lonicera macranthoides]